MDFQNFFFILKKIKTIYVNWESEREKDALNVDIKAYYFLENYDQQQVNQSI